MFQFGFIIYSNDVKVEFQITSAVSDSLESLTTAIGRAEMMPLQNLTGTPPALEVADVQLTLYDRDDALYPDVVMFITDGHITPPTSQAENEAFLRPYAERVKNITE